MRAVVRTWIVSVCLAVLPSLSTADTFMLVPGVSGDSTDPAHKGWIRVSTVDWDVKADTSWTRGGGASIGKPNPGKLKLSLATGPWSTEFLRSIAMGRAFTQVVIDHVASDGRPLYRVKADSLFVTDYKVASTDRTLPEDRLEGVFQILRLEIFTFTADGKIGTTAVEWNVATGTVK